MNVFFLLTVVSAAFTCVYMYKFYCMDPVPDEHDQKFFISNFSMIKYILSLHNAVYSDNENHSDNEVAYTELAKLGSIFHDHFSPKTRSGHTLSRLWNQAWFLRRDSYWLKNIGAELNMPWGDNEYNVSVENFFPEMDRHYHYHEYRHVFRLFNNSTYKYRIDRGDMYTWCPFVEEQERILSRVENSVKCLERWFRVLFTLGKFCFFMSIENHLSKIENHISEIENRISELDAQLALDPELPYNYELPFDPYEMNQGDQYRLDPELPFDPYETTLDGDLWEIRGNILAQTFLKRAHEETSLLPEFYHFFTFREMRILATDLLLQDILRNIPMYYKYFYTEKKINDKVIPNITITELQALYLAAGDSLTNATPFNFRKVQIMESLKEYFRNLMTRNKTEIYYSFRKFLFE